MRTSWVGRVISCVFVISLAGGLPTRDATRSIAVAASAPQGGNASPQRPEIVVSTGHSGNVVQAAKSSDERFLVTSGDDATLRIWDLETLHELRTLVESGSIFDLALSPDDRWVAAAVGNRVDLWDIATGVKRKTLSGPGTSWINAIAIAPDGSSLAAATSDSRIRVWDVEAGSVRVEFATVGELICLAFSPDGSQLAGGGVRSAALWRLASPAAPTTLAGHTAGVHAVAFGPRGTLATGSWDGTIRLWDTATGAAVRTIPGVGSVTSLAFSHTGDVLAAGTTVPNLSLWNVQTGARLRTITVEGAPATRETSLEQKVEAYPEVAKQSGAWSVLADAAPEGGRLRSPRGGYRSSVMFTASDSAVITTIDPLFARVWLANTGQPGVVLMGAGVQQEGTVFSPNGRWLMCSGGRRSVAVWDLLSGTQVRVIDGPSGPLAFDSTDRLMATVEDDGHRVVLRESETGKQTATLPTHIDEDNTGPGAVHVAVVAISPDFQWLASMSGKGGTHAKVWRIADDKRMFDFTGHDSFVTNLAFSPDSTLLASLDDSVLKVWDLKSGRLLQTLKADLYSAAAFSPDSHLVAYAPEGGDAVRVVNARTGSQVLQQKLADSASGLTFSPDGRTIAVGMRREAVVLDSASGRVMQSIATPAATANLTFTPGGRWLATANSDGVTRLWDPASGELGLAVAPMEKNLETYENDESWLVATPEGLFDGPPEAWGAVSLRFNGNTFDVSPVEIGFRTYYAPGLLAQVLSGGRPKPLEELGRIDRRQVRVGFVSTEPRAEGPTNSRRIRIQLQVVQSGPDRNHPSPSGVRDVRLFRNGSLVKAWGGDVKLDARGTAVLETDVTIVEGKNHFVAYAFSKSDIKSRDASLEVEGGAALRRPSTAYIVAVGVNRYVRPGLDLKYAVPDALAFAEAVSKGQSTLKNFTSVKIVRLLDADATTANIQAALGKLAGRPSSLTAQQTALLDGLEPATPEDTVFIYFAGHGAAVSGRFYLLPTDFALTANEAIDPAHVVSDEHLGGLMSDIDASRIVLVIDACQSGQALESDDARQGPMNSRGLAQLAYDKGMYILTASQAYQAALETSQLGHGLLTYALVEEGLKSPAAGRDHLVHLRQWLDYATVRVPQLQAAFLSARDPNRGVPSATVAATLTSLQRPRLFYRREPEAKPLVLAVF